VNFELLVGVGKDGKSREKGRDPFIKKGKRGSQPLVTQKVEPDGRGEERGGLPTTQKEAGGSKLEKEKGVPLGEKSGITRRKGERRFVCWGRKGGNSKTALLAGEEKKKPRKKWELKTGARGGNVFPPKRKGGPDIKHREKKDFPEEKMGELPLEKKIPPAGGKGKPQVFLRIEKKKKKIHLSGRKGFPPSFGKSPSEKRRFAIAASTGRKGGSFSPSKRKRRNDFFRGKKKKGERASPREKKKSP